MEELKPEIIKEKGKPGRRVGSKNKTTRDMRGKYQKFLESSFKTIMKKFNALDIKEQIKFHNAVANLVVPKASVSRQEVYNTNGNDNTPVTFTLNLGDIATQENAYKGSHTATLIQDSPTLLPERPIQLPEPIIAPISLGAYGL